MKKSTISFHVFDILIIIVKNLGWLDSSKLAFGKATDFLEVELLIRILEIGFLE